jgi:hypothetical protein
LPEPATYVSSGYFGKCAVLDSGRIACWDGDMSAYLGFGKELEIYDLCE